MKTIVNGKEVVVTVADIKKLYREVGTCATPKAIQAGQMTALWLAEVESRKQADAAAEFGYSTGTVSGYLNIASAYKVFPDIAQKTLRNALQWASSIANDKDEHGNKVSTLTVTYAKADVKEEPKK